MGSGLLLHILHEYVIELILLLECSILLPQELIIRLSSEMLFCQPGVLVLEVVQLECPELQVVV